MRISKYVFVAMAATFGQHLMALPALDATEPANHAMLESAPAALILSFSEPVRLTSVTVQKHGATEKQSLGPLPSGTLDRFTVAAPGLNQGGYTVTWRALSEDADVVSGEFMFVVGAMGHGDMRMNHAEHMQHMRHSENMQHGPGMEHGQQSQQMPPMRHDGADGQHQMPDMRTGHGMSHGSTGDGDAASH